jgi:hypothetical protein
MEDRALELAERQRPLGIANPTALTRPPQTDEQRDSGGGAGADDGDPTLRSPRGLVVGHVWSQDARDRAAERAQRPQVRARLRRRYRRDGRRLGRGLRSAERAA